MRGDDRGLVWVVAGALGSMVLAVLVIPLRAVVAASNLAFVFIAFTIVVAELGGRGPALVTALVSAMSLNFFLTEPYLTLAITKTDDVVAFFALAACGLIAAAFGRLHHRLRNRRQVLLLTELDDHVLSDIGVTRSDVRSALSRPFSADPSLELERIALSNRSRWRRI